jgi:hypothetical protein
VDTCYDTSQLKQVNIQRSLRKKTSEILGDKSASTEIAKAIKAITSADNNPPIDVSTRDLMEAEMTKRIKGDCKQVVHEAYNDDAGEAY